MSSLRISHGSRALGAPAASGDAARADHPDDSGSFALALGVAGIAPKNGAILLGDKAGGGSGGAPTQKRPEERGKPADAALSLAVGILITPPDVSSPPGNEDELHHRGTDASAGGSPDPLAAATGLSDAAPAVGLTDAAAATDLTKVAPAGLPIAPPPTGAETGPSAASGPSPTAAFLPADASPGVRQPASGAAKDIIVPVVSGASPAAAPAAPPAIDPISVSADAALRQGSAEPPRDSVADGAAVMPTTAGEPPPSATRRLPPEPSAITSVAVRLIPAGSGPIAAAPTTDVDSDGVSGAATQAGQASAAPNSSALALPTPNLVSALPPMAGLRDIGQSGLRDPGNGSFGSTFAAAARDRFAPATASGDPGNAAMVVSRGNTDGAAPATLPALPSGSAADAVAPSSIPDQVGGHLLRMMSSGAREMVMRLHPPELGDVTVRVAVNGRDVSAWFASPQPQVESAINAAIGQLQTDLGNAGYNLSGAWVGADASNGRQPGSGAAPAQPRSPYAPAAAVLPGSAGIGRPAASGLNIYV